MTEIKLTDFQPSQPVKITQLYEHLELFSLGEPPVNTVFVLGRSSLGQIESVAQLEQLGAEQDQLLLIDPPVDAGERFVLDGNVAALFTGEPQEIGLPLLQTQPGGIAHIQIGQHYLDIYSQVGRNVVHFPALGLICCGEFGSDCVVPTVVHGSNGDEELETLRLLAQLIKRSGQLLIPRVGSPEGERVEVMKRLAADVGYLHQMRRTIPPWVEKGVPLVEVLARCERLLPEAWSSQQSLDRHMENVVALYDAS